jgi:hypothetical protein
VRLVRRKKDRLHAGGELLGQGREPPSDLLLAVPLLEERVCEHGGRGRRHASHRLAENAGDLGDRILPEAELEICPDRGSGSDIFVAEHAVVRPCLGEPEQSPVAKQQLSRNAGPCGDLSGRVLSAENSLNRQ